MDLLAQIGKAEDACLVAHQALGTLLEHSRGVAKEFDQKKSLSQEERDELVTLCQLVSLAKEAFDKACLELKPALDMFEERSQAAEETWRKLHEA